MRSILVIAGMDPTAGAGILADMRVATMHGLRAVGVPTAATVQDTEGVRAVEPATPSVVKAQLRALIDDVRIDAVKIGMLGDTSIARVVAEALGTLDAEVPVIWDPVLMPSRGGVPLLRGDVRDALAALLPRVRLITPNLNEVSAISGIPIADLPAMRQAATGLRAAGARAVLIKGGHLPPPHDATDLLDDGGFVVTLAGERIATPGPVHGSGCVLSTAIACNMAEGQTLQQAVAGAKAFMTERLRKTLAVGKGARCLV
jgi:hydroxymethylpyrimidine/phosphomethylpyrimidine kinase